MITRRLRLIGGPRDGDLLEIQMSVPWIDDLEMYFPHDGHTIHPIATYRWLHGEPDHLDFVGYEPCAD